MSSHKEMAQVTCPCCAAMFSTRTENHSALAEIRAVVNAQADDPGLWPIYRMGEQRITEAYLQQELRRLHAVVERVTPDPKEPA